MATNAPPTSKRLGKYEISRKLGSGNFSKVRLATDTETGQTFAMKIIEKELLMRQNMEEQLRREITLMRKLRHPNIVRLYDVMQTDNHIYLVLELVTGGELFEKIATEHKFPEDMARYYFKQLMCGLRYCHEQGIAHRDLKPENLLLDASGTLKITDFGLSNVQRVNTIPAVGTSSAIEGGNANFRGNTLNNAPAAMLHTVCGTPNYIAPELLKERGYDGLKADLWSCGVVLYVMLAGYLPFEDENINGLFNKIERGEYRMSRSFSPEAKDLIAKMLTVNPNHRITIDGIMSHPWITSGT